MKTNLLFDFTIDRKNNRIQVTREFNAGRQLVWDAWTQAEMLDQWWAPKPYRAETKSLDLRVGGTWLYAMVGPEGSRDWAKADYKTIEPVHTLSWLDAFCDEQGVENENKPRSLWTNTFREASGITTVDITLAHDSFADIELMLQMGFKEGFTMAMGNLDDLFLTFRTQT